MQESKTALPNGREDVVYDADSRNDVNCFDSQLSRQITCDAYFNQLFAASKRMDTSLEHVEASIYAEKWRTYRDCRLLI